jgi:hypothetical protein
MGIGNNKDVRQRERGSRTRQNARRRIRTSVILFLCLTTAWVCRAADDRHVVLITIDGFPARMFWDSKSPIPRLRQLAPPQRAFMWPDFLSMCSHRKRMAVS